MKKLQPVDKRVAPWKIDNPIERFSGKKANQSEFWKRMYVHFYKIFDSTYYQKGMKFIKREIDRFDPNCSDKQRSIYMGHDLFAAQIWVYV